MLKLKLKPELHFLMRLGILNFLCFGVVKSVCVIRYPVDIETAPTYTRHFGRYSLELPYTRSDIILQDGENIDAKCATTFSFINKRYIGSYYDSYREEDLEKPSHIKLTCLDSTLHSGLYILDDFVLKCRKLNWTLYEDYKTQNWCKMDTGLIAPLLLAAKSNFAHHILAEICFDLHNWSLQAITYNVTIPNENIEMLRDIKKTDLQTVDVLGENLWNLKSTHNFDLKESDLQEQLKKMSQHNFWLHLANYELSPIVQGNSYRNYFDNYSNILNTIWWSNLRLGNWKRFMDTLENYAYNNSFQLYTGTSGVVRKPIENMADLSKNLTIKMGYKEKPVPAYIWAYLTSMDKTNKDFIIVGYNSPYAEFFSRNEIVFCEDICDEIPWLKGISNSFKFNTAGIMFCCSPESLKQTNILNGFPMKVLISRTSVTPDQENETSSTLRSYTTNTNAEKAMILDAGMDTKIIADNEIKSEELLNNEALERNDSEEEINEFEEERNENDY